MKYIQGQNISADNEVRLIDLFVENLALESFGFQIDHGENG
jgi:hypothetical protein